MVWLLMCMLSYRLKPSGLYRHRIELGLHRVGYNGRRSEHPYRQACLPRQGKSLPDTGRSLQSCIFIVQESGWRYSSAIRTPPNPGLPHPPSDESNSSTHTLFNFPSCLPEDDCYDDCYDSVDSLEISLFDYACYACGQDANMNDAYGDELAIVPYVMNGIVAIAPHAW